MELAARDFSYTLARIYIGSREEKRNGFQGRKGLGVSPRMAQFHTFWVKGWSFTESWVPPFFPTEAAQPGKCC